MKIAYLIPEGSYEFFYELRDALEDYGHQVFINTLDYNPDIILGAILPLTPKWGPQLAETKVPFILWHWDFYSFVDYEDPRWKNFIALLPRAVDIWSCGYETARQLKEIMGLESYMVPAWVDSRNFYAPPEGVLMENYVLYASSSAAFGKRVDWAEKACALLKLPLKLTKQQKLPRAQYFELLAPARVYLMTAFEESNGTIPAMEAVANGVPIVLADLPSSREVFGTTCEGVHYFKPWDFGDLLVTLGRAYQAAPNETGGSAKDRILKLFSLGTVAARINTRLKEVYHGQVAP